MQHTKQRLDHLIAQMRPDVSRSLIQSWIAEGKITVDGKVVTKSSMQLYPDVKIEFTADGPEFVSRSGAKLHQALRHFAIDVTGMTALDVGLSTGGFTDCLLQAGAAKVFGVDVGTGQVHPKIAADSRVVVMEQTDVRKVHDAIGVVDFVCIDVSFISVTKIIDAVARHLQPGGHLVVLIKPQFEAGPKAVNRQGVIKDAMLRDQIVEKVVAALVHTGFSLQGLIKSFILGGDGNTEYLAYYRKE